MNDIKNYEQFNNWVRFLLYFRKDILLQNKFKQLLIGIKQKLKSNLDEFG